MWRRAACPPVLVLFALSAAPARGVTPLRPLGLAQGPAVSDGERYAAYDPVPGVTRIIDTGGPGSRVVAEPDDCRAAAVGVGQLMWGCDIRCSSSARWESAVLYDLASGVARDGPFARAPACGTDGGTEMKAIGTRWIAYRAWAYHVTLTVYADRADGRYLRESEDPRRTVDLDAASGELRMCAPMRREYNDAFNLVSNTYRPFDYERPWGLTTTGGDEHSPPSAGYGLLLHHCGRRPVRISRCGGRSCWNTSLASGIVTWSDGHDQVWALRPATGRRRRWPALPAPVNGVAHTRTRLFVSTIRYGRTGADPAVQRVYSASLKGL
jgi:hypothetical protein